eukprot:TRINITY_DN2289_c0_g2_i7.p1 TRINITY_DN2289_c0_g2~~TRINITY_DN2289_c0_g2_i7.p1  ORF type:complete len:181 (-),score=45.37 TRINITY_DN2289_c0_g2_i7:144-686(-)
MEIEKKTSCFGDFQYLVLVGDIGVFAWSISKASNSDGLIFYSVGLVLTLLTIWKLHAKNVFFRFIVFADFLIRTLVWALMAVAQILLIFLDGKKILSKDGLIFFLFLFWFLAGFTIPFASHKKKKSEALIANQNIPGVMVLLQTPQGYQNITGVPFQFSQNGTPYQIQVLQPNAFIPQQH